MLLRFDHVQLAMPAGDDAERRAESFYGGVLGLVRLPKPDALAARGGCWFGNPTVALHLGVEDPFLAARKAHPALVVDDIDGLASTIEAAGGDVRWNHELPDVRRFHTDDPFGNRLELIAGP